MLDINGRGKKKKKKKLGEADFTKKILIESGKKWVQSRIWKGQKTDAFQRETRLRGMRGLNLKEVYKEEYIVFVRCIRIAP